jgi:hypothetical protein
MSTSTVDTKKRIILPGGRPGDVFDIQQQEEGRFLLIRLEKPLQAKLETGVTSPLLIKGFDNNLHYQLC